MKANEIYNLALDKYRLNLDSVPMGLRGEAFQAFLDGNVGDILITLENTNHLKFVIYNISALKSRGIFEEALVDALSSSRINNCQWSPSLIEGLLVDSDREKIRAAGDLLPAGETFAIYRGVIGTRPYRYVRGMSWSSSLECACWFALRFEDKFDNPAIYKARIKRDDVYCYLHQKGRLEQEFICRPKTVKRMNLSIDEMRRMSEAWNMKSQKKQMRKYEN